MTDQNPETTTKMKKYGFTALPVIFPSNSSEHAVPKEAKDENGHNRMQS